MIEIVIALYLALSLGMGMFSVTQLGYQNRATLVEQIYRIPFAFVKGFLGWVILFPYGMYKGKYKCNVSHKIGRDIK